MGYPKSVWGELKSSKLREKIKHCTKSLCECVDDFIKNLVDGNQHHSLKYRFARMLADDAVSSQIPNHAAEIEAVKRPLNEALKFHDDNNCPSGGLPANAREYADKSPPTQQDWEELHGRPMPQYTFGQKVGLGFLYTGGAVAAAAAVIAAGPELIVGGAIAGAFASAF